MARRKVEAVRAAITAEVVATAAGLAPEALRGGGQAARLARAREGAARLWCRRDPGERLAARWDQVWQQLP